MICTKCRQPNPKEARFCGRCGQALSNEDAAATPQARVEPPSAAVPVVAVQQHVAGEVADRRRHSEPLEAPAGFLPLTGVPDLHYRWNARWGGPICLESEPTAITLFNGGHGLVDGLVRVRGLNGAAKELFSIHRQIELLERGGQETISLPSPELSAPLKAVEVTLVTGAVASWS